MKESKNEYILCAAIYYNDGNKYREQPLNIESGIIISGRRHNNAFMTLLQLKPDFDANLIKPMMGFITSYNRYVERPEAYKIALEQGQIKKREIDDDDYNILISEDLYYGFD